MINENDYTIDQLLRAQNDAQDIMTQRHGDAWYSLHIDDNIDILDEYEDEFEALVAQCIF